MADSNTQDPLVGTLLAERYRVDALLGHGGMGAVYRAEHIHMRKVFAVKVLHRQMTVVEEAVRRFEREAIAAGRIEHPNVAAATDFGQLPDGAFYLVLEYVAGRNLRELLEEEGALEPARALAIARQIAQALGAAHAHGVVHRDLKPDNVMLIEKGTNKDFVKVLDFGIAKVPVDGAAGSQLTQFGTVFGTPQYMAPEQAAGKAVDTRADLYALGLILDEMMRGRPTFEAEEIIGLLTKQMTEPPPPLPSHVPRPAARLVRDLLSKEPEARPASTADVVERIDALIGAVPPPTRRGSLASAAAGSAPSLDVRASRIAPVLSTLLTLLRAGARHTLGFAERRSIRRIPNYVLALPVLLVVVIFFVARGGDQDRAGQDGDQSEEGESGANEAEQSDVPSAEERALDPELARVVAAAREGNESALFALDQRKASDRTKIEWLALALGRLKRRDVTRALEAYGQALDLDAALSRDKRMLAGLRYFAERDSARDQVLKFAADRLGADGADLLFNVWSSTSLRTPATVRAKELLDTRSVRKSMTPALRFALELRDAKSCEDFAKLLPKVRDEGDERSFAPLRPLLKADGCGASGKDDCYPCLRHGSLLKDAVTQAQMRNAPRYATKRWR
jgi:serine/threonine-protein kinase